MTEWRPILGWEDRYEVSDHGQVRTVEHEHPYGGHLLTSRVLKVHIRADNGRPQVQLWRGTSRRTFRVHVLVAEAFLGPRPPGQIVLHGDDDVTNNYVGNLRWGTRSDNVQDALARGRHWQVSKTHCPRNHEYTDQNTYRNRRGHRQCRTCNRERRMGE